MLTTQRANYSSSVLLWLVMNIEHSFGLLYLVSAVCTSPLCTEEGIETAREKEPRLSEYYLRRVHAYSAPVSSKDLFSGAEAQLSGPTTAFPRE